MGIGKRVAGVLFLFCFVANATTLTCPNFLSGSEWQAFLKTPGSANMLTGADSLSQLTFENLKRFCHQPRPGEYYFEGQLVTANTAVETALLEKNPQREVAQVRLYFKGRAEPIVSRLEVGGKNHITFAMAVDLVNDALLIAARSQLFYDALETVEFTHTHPAPEFIVVKNGDEEVVNLPLNEDDRSAGSELLKTVQKLTPTAKVRIRAVTPGGITYSLSIGN